MNQSIRLLIIFALIIIWNRNSNAQVVYEHVSYRNIYDFLDEMANEKIINLNSAIKPYSRVFIAEKLDEISQKPELLNKRQKGELDFYLKDYNKELKPDKKFNKRFDLFYYKDSLFTLSINPILGVSYYNNDSASVYKRWNGAEAFAYIGQHWGFYASLRDNYESEAFSNQEYLNQHTGATFKDSEISEKNEDVEYSEMRGGVTYQWDWGTTALVKDHFVWGDNYNGANIFSGKTPSFAQWKLNLKPTKWFEFNYVHGWLVSDVLDSANSYYDNDGHFRTVMHEKYVAANMFTFKPWKTLAVSLGNSIIYSDMNVHPAYLNPFMFYKSVDHTYNSTDNMSGQNAQMFGNISFRGIKHLHLYSSLFFDELHITNMWDENKHTNWFSAKGGFRVSNLIANTSLTFEYTRTNPMVYEHFINTTTFESNQYTLGHYLKHNAEEIFLGLDYRPIKKLHLNASFSTASKGKDYVYGSIEPTGIPFIDSVTWESKQIDFSAAYEINNNSGIKLQFRSSDLTGNNLRYAPSFMHGKMNTLILEIHYGF